METLDEYCKKLEKNEKNQEKKQLFKQLRNYLRRK